MSQALRDLLRSETDRLKDAGLYKREVVFSRAGGMAAGGMVAGRLADDSLGQAVVNYTTHDFLGLSVDPQLQQAAIDRLCAERDRAVHACMPGDAACVPSIPWKLTTPSKSAPDLA